MVMYRIYCVSESIPQIFCGVLIDMKQKVGKGWTGAAFRHIPNNPLHER